MAMREREREQLYDLQRHRRQRWVATALAAVLGLGLATLHWSGLAIGGALVGWAWPTLTRATVAGFGFGVVALVTFASTLVFADALEPALGMGAITLVTAAMPLVLGTLGGLSRGLAGNAPAEPAD